MTVQGADRSFDAAALKRECSNLADPHLHYLDNAAIAPMLEAVLVGIHRGARDSGGQTVGVLLRCDVELDNG